MGGGGILSPYIKKEQGGGGLSTGDFVLHSNFEHKIVIIFLPCSDFFQN